MVKRAELSDSIIIDLDGTLTDFSHRLPLLQDEKNHFSDFFKSMSDDALKPFAKTIIDRFKETHGIIIITGRPDNYRRVTEQWLEDNEVFYDGLFMREMGDMRPDYEIKQELYEKYVRHFANVIFVIDDRDAVVKMWRSVGLVCLQCADGNY